MVHTDRIVELGAIPSTGTTPEYVWWWNNQRVHVELDMRTTLEVETEYHGDQESTPLAPARQENL